MYVREKNCRCSSSGPSNAAGSATPRCAVTGRPGQIGQTSLAALSQTVKTKSRAGAPARSNSLQLFDRSPEMSWPRAFSTSSAIGWTLPWGWLPALYARILFSPSRFRMASARMLRAEFPVQRNSAL